MAEVGQSALRTANLWNLSFGAAGITVEIMATPKQPNHLRATSHLTVAFLAIVVWTLSQGISRAAEDAATNQSSRFLRFVATNATQGHVDTAITTYRRQDGVVVSLIAAVHVADADYYQKLQARFKDFEAVLYELVKPKETDMRRRPQTNSPVSVLQIGIKNLLALEFQLEAIDYAATNFVHADMDAATFRLQQEAKGESILGLMIRAVLEEQNRNPDSLNSFDGFQFLFALMSKDSAYKLKFLLAQQLENVEAILSGVDRGKDGEGSVLLSGRNQVAMDVLTKQIDKGKRKLAIFYGAGHMPDFEKRLWQSGFKKSSELWVTAWDIRPKPSAKP